MHIGLVPCLLLLISKEAKPPKCNLSFFSTMKLNFFGFLFSGCSSVLRKTGKGVDHPVQANEAHDQQKASSQLSIRNPAFIRDDSEARSASVALGRSSSQDRDLPEPPSSVNSLTPDADGEVHAYPTQESGDHLYEVCPMLKSSGGQIITQETQAAPKKITDGDSGYVRTVQYSSVKPRASTDPGYDDVIPVTTAATSEVSAMEQECSTMSSVSEAHVDAMHPDAEPEYSVPKPSISGEPEYEETMSDDSNNEGASTSTEVLPVNPNPAAGSQANERFNLADEADDVGYSRLQDGSQAAEIIDRCTPDARGKDTTPQTGNYEDDAAGIYDDTILPREVRSEAAGIYDDTALPREVRAPIELERLPIRKPKDEDVSPHNPHTDRNELVELEEEGRQEKADDVSFQKVQTPRRTAQVSDV